MKEDINTFLSLEKTDFVLQRTKIQVKEITTRKGKGGREESGASECVLVRFWRETETIGCISHDLFSTIYQSFIHLPILEKTDFNIYPKHLAHLIVEAGRSAIYKAAQQAGDLWEKLMLQFKPKGKIPSSSGEVSLKCELNFMYSSI